MFRKIKSIFEKIKIRLFNYKKGNKLKIIVTGPPRSGTSFLCGLIVRMGFDPGPESWLKKGDQNNPYGYYECEPLMAIDHSLLGKFGGSVIDPPVLPGNWIGLCNDEKKQIRKIVENGGVELYKGNMLVILADLYAELFPDVKWIMFHRGVKETIRSIQNTGTQISSQELTNTWEKWMEGWKKTSISSRSLTIRYEDFMDNPQQMVSAISDYLNVTLTEKRFRECVAFFRPRQKRVQ